MMTEHRKTKQTPDTSKSAWMQIDEKQPYICRSAFDYKSQSVVTPEAHQQ